MRGFLCPAGHRSGSPSGSKCGEPLRSEHRGHRCQLRVMPDPALNLCPRCARGVLIPDPEEGDVCSYCAAAFNRPDTTAPAPRRPHRRTRSAQAPEVSGSRTENLTFTDTFNAVRESFA